MQRWIKDRMWKIIFPYLFEGLFTIILQRFWTISLPTIEVEHRKDNYFGGIGVCSCKSICSRPVTSRVRGAADEDYKSHNDQQTQRLKFKLRASHESVLVRFSDPVQFSCGWCGWVVCRDFCFKTFVLFQTSFEHICRFICMGFSKKMSEIVKLVF